MEDDDLKEIIDKTDPLISFDDIGNFISFLTLTSEERDAKLVDLCG